MLNVRRDSFIEFHREYSLGYFQKNKFLNFRIVIEYSLVVLRQLDDMTTCLAISAAAEW
jgi:hypothetical protein